ncbi:MAG TPA: hypothetical protein VFT45_14560, partial [Longimicrobium sp.]|nr:hypothetical protein [Longimicrobium sp.]
MNDVAAPLYRFFLADAQAAARAGDVGRMLECIGLALDFVPESQRERVLLAAAELAPPAAATPALSRVAGAPAGGVSPPLVVQIAAGAAAQRPMARLAWEDRATRPPDAVQFVTTPTSPDASGHAPRRSRAGLVVAGLLALAVLGVGVGGAAGWLPGTATAPLLGDPVERAASAVAAGDSKVALELLEPLGPDAPAAAWLVRASAHVAMSDTSAAVQALAAAAMHDAEGGGAALEAGDRLLRLGAVREAADAYLYAVTPERSTGEIERIARTQEQAGYPERARRVLQR